MNQSDLDLPDISNKERPKNQIIEAFRKTERKLIWIFAIAVPLFSLTPWLFTRPGFSWLNFTETGNIGATIGGITAPFFSLLASVIIYFSFRAQMQMNIIQQQRMDAQDKEKRYEKQRETMMTLSSVIFDNTEIIGKEFKNEGILNKIYSDLNYKFTDKGDLFSNLLASNDVLVNRFDGIYDLVYPIWYLDTLSLLKREDRLLLYSLNTVKWKELEAYLEKSIEVFNFINQQTDNAFNDFKEKFRYKPTLDSYLLIITNLTN